MIGMSNVIPFRKPMRAEEFQAEVRNRAVFSHMVIKTDHLDEQMALRGITFRQVLNVMRKGTAVYAPNFNQRHSSYEGKMKYHGSGRAITVLCGLQQSNLYVFGITVY